MNNLELRRKFMQSENTYISWNHTIESYNNVLRFNGEPYAEYYHYLGNYGNYGKVPCGYWVRKDFIGSDSTTSLFGSDPIPIQKETTTLIPFSIAVSGGKTLYISVKAWHNPRGSQLSNLALKIDDALLTIDECVNKRLIKPIVPCIGNIYGTLNLLSGLSTSIGESLQTGLCGFAIMTLGNHNFEGLQIWSRLELSSSYNDGIVGWVGDTSNHFFSVA